VEEVLKKIPKNATVLDVCTGSGCILLSILKEREDANGIGLDLSEDALLVAETNRKNLELLDRSEFRQGDLFTPLNDEKFDLVVSNPPYIRTDVIDTLSIEVKSHDPYMALDGGDDGLIFYRRIAKESKTYLKEGGMLFFEIGHDQSEEVIQIMEDEGFYDVVMVRDYAGNPRIVYGTKG
jgi:release factor glutamine methyltransferase